MEYQVLNDGHYHHTDITARKIPQPAFAQIEYDDLFLINDLLYINGGVTTKEICKDTEIEKVLEFLVNALPGNGQVALNEFEPEEITMFFALSSGFHQIFIFSVHHEPLQIQKRPSLLCYYFKTGLQNALHLQRNGLAISGKNLAKGVPDNLALFLNIQFVLKVYQLKWVDARCTGGKAAIHINQPLCVQSFLPCDLFRQIPVRFNQNHALVIFLNVLDDEVF